MTESNVVSPKAQRRQARRLTKDQRQSARTPKPLQPKNRTQRYYLECLHRNEQVFAIGAAGSGKTYLAARHAVRQLLDRQTERVVICRPTVSKAKHRQGFLPGGLLAKQRPWLVPLVEAMKDECGGSTIDSLMHQEQVEFLAFEHMRGRSISNATIILDEAQNCDLGDLKMFLTRVGTDSQVIICGDVDQVDIEDSGLAYVVEMVHDHSLSAAVIEFGPEDVVRSQIAREWVRAFSREPPSR
jgi:phosphate starvation-inducible PhoH-like protein